MSFQLGISGTDAVMDHCGGFPYVQDANPYLQDDNVALPMVEETEAESVVHSILD